jgi:hypothetical protein
LYAQCCSTWWRFFPLCCSIGTPIVAQLLSFGLGLTVDIFYDTAAARGGAVLLALRSCVAAVVPARWLHSADQVAPNGRALACIEFCWCAASRGFFSSC